MNDNVTFSHDIVSCSVEQTLQIGIKLGKHVGSGDIITLSGDLGAGKTILTKGIAIGMGITAPVSSPTFTIIKEYVEGRLPLYHFDLYRLGKGAIDEDLGFEEYLYGAGVCVIEWSEYIDELLPADRLNIAIKHGTGRDNESNIDSITNINSIADIDNVVDDARTISFSYTNNKWDSLTILGA